MTQELLNEDNLVAYLKSQSDNPVIAGLLGTSVTVENLSTGNMNRVFRARGADRSLVVKQAPPFVASVGSSAPTDPKRALTEAHAYQLLNLYVPGSAPEILLLDRENYVMVMEDLVDCQVLRYALVAEQQRADGVGYGSGPCESSLPIADVSSAVGAIVGELSRATSRQALGDAAFAEFADRNSNLELCEITHRYVLEYPYIDFPGNKCIPELRGSARAARHDRQLLKAVAGIRAVFDGRRQALLHGDLHTGSIMVRNAPPAGGPRLANSHFASACRDFGRCADDRRPTADRDPRLVVKLFDAEFSFVGPIGYDLGLFWANLLVASITAGECGKTEPAKARARGTAASWAGFVDALGNAAEVLPLQEIQADAWQFAGVDAMRRVIGSAVVEDLTTLDGVALVNASHRVFDLAHWLIVDGRSLDHEQVMTAVLGLSVPTAYR